MKTTRLLLGAVLGSSVCVAAEADRLADGKRLTAEAIANDGVPGAIGYCSEKALPLTASVDANLRRDEATGFQLGELRRMWRGDFRPAPNTKQP